MALDGFFLRKIVNELNEELKTGRINKINNISNHDFIFNIRKNSNKKLIISINPSNFRIHLTKKQYENPYKPSNFCTLLRKYLLNGFISKIEQIRNDRIINITIKNKNDLGYEFSYILIIELMGKHSNIILTDENFVIIDALKNAYNIEFNRYTIANTKYKLPPTKEKIDPFENNNKILKIENINDNNFFINNFYGVSKDLNDYLNKNYFNNFKLFIENFNNLNTPTLYQNKKIKDFYYFDIKNENTNKLEFENYSELLDFFYTENQQNDINKLQNKKLYTFIDSKLHKLKNKIVILEQEIEKNKNSNDFLLKGQLLISNNYLFKKNIPKIVKLQNFYRENLEDIEIKLNPNMTVEQNAELYFKKHKKNKRTLENLKKQIEITKNEIIYFDNISTQINDANASDLEEIKEELIKYKYLKDKIEKKYKKTKYTIINYNENSIYVGKNNTQNDAITNKLAKKEFLWFHAKDIPGSHVVIFNDNPDEDTINFAATIAGYYSKAKNEDYVLVDYTKIKYVKKISGSKAGMVTYSNNKTIKIKIDKMLINNYI